MSTNNKLCGHLILRDVTRYKSTTYKCLYAYYQFEHTEWFAQIVVGSRLKSPHHILRLGKCSEKEYRSGDVLVSYSFHHLKSVHIGHHHVSHNYVGTFMEEQLQPTLPILGSHYLETLRVECVTDDYGKRCP